MAETRTQLTLFVDERDSVEIERIREELNPSQFRLIKSHVIENAILPSHLTFRTISLIEQIDGGRWEILETFDLRHEAR